MNLTEKECKYLLTLLDMKKFQVQQSIKKVGLNPDRYVDDPAELQEWISFIDGIISKLNTQETVPDSSCHAHQKAESNTVTLHKQTVDREDVRRALRCLKDNGIERSECPVVLQALGYTLLDVELDPLFVEADYEPVAISRYCSISTAHLTKETMLLLEKAEKVENNLPIYFPKRIYDNLYGYIFVVAGWDDDAEAAQDCPEDLKACMRYAESMDCAMLVIDSDCETVDELPVYDW